MSQDFFKDLPSDITLNILSRLPVKTTMKCKCVCKPWLDLLTTPEFVKSHLSKSVPGLAVFKRGKQSKPFKIVEFIDEVDPICHDHPWNIVFNLDLPFPEPLHSSANGLLFLCLQENTGSRGRGGHLLCNPVTHDYIKLPSPRKTYSQPMLQLEIYGFGVSKITGQYKVVRMFIDEKLPLQSECKFDRYKCQIYTVGTGSWRTIPSGKRLSYVDCGGKSLNGNLHFLASKRFPYEWVTPHSLGSEGFSFEWISCLDLETENFSTFAAPPPSDDPHKARHLSILKDCLCVCDNSTDEMTASDEIDIWLMKEYGDEKSWTKEFVIRKAYMDIFLGFLCPVKVFQNGDILMELASTKLLYYASLTKTIREVDLCGMGSSIRRSTTIYSPSFLPLKTFEMENVSSF